MKTIWKNYYPWQYWPKFCWGKILCTFLKFDNDLFTFWLDRQSNIESLRLPWVDYIQDLFDWKNFADFLCLKNPNRQNLFHEIGFVRHGWCSNNFQSRLSDFHPGEKIPRSCCKDLQINQDNSENKITIGRYPLSKYSLKVQSNLLLVFY